MKFVLQSKTNKDKSTEIFPPLLLKPTNTWYMRLRTDNAESQKDHQNVTILKKTTWLCPSKRDYSMENAILY